MARGNSQKLKILYLLRILQEETDERHPLGAAALLQRLEAYGIQAERKSVYDDIEQLRSFGYDIVFVKSRTQGGYYLGSREFELPELKLLVDAVQASKFMTARKSRELIGKLERFASREEGRQLQRQVYVAGRMWTPFIAPCRSRCRCPFCIWNGGWTANCIRARKGPCTGSAPGRFCGAMRIII